MVQKEVFVHKAKCEECGRTRGSEHKAKCPHFTLAPGKSKCPSPTCVATTDQRIGHKDDSVYDGVLFWECAKCGHVYTRNFGTTYMNAKSQTAVNNYLTKIRGVVLDPGRE